MGVGVSPLRDAHSVSGGLTDWLRGKPVDHSVERSIRDWFPVHGAPCRFYVSTVNDL